MNRAWDFAGKNGSLPASRELPAWLTDCSALPAAGATAASQKNTNQAAMHTDVRLLFRMYERTRAQGTPSTSPASQDSMLRLPRRRAESSCIRWR